MRGQGDAIASKVAVVAGAESGIGRLAAERLAAEGRRSTTCERRPDLVPLFGSRGRIGLVIPANNATLEPEVWSVMPHGVAAYSTKILTEGDLTPAAVHAMEGHFDRAVEELAATGVDIIVYADMVTTFIMEPDWNVQRTAAVTARTGIPCLSAWMALDRALAALGARRIALGSPYPRDVHDLASPFFRAQGYEIAGEGTLDILAMREVPEVAPEHLEVFARSLPQAGAETLVLLATDLPTFDSIAALEEATGLPVLTSNQTILWAALRACGNNAIVPRLGRLFAAG